MRLYKQQRLIMMLANQIMKVLLPCCQFFIIVPAVFAAYAMVKLEGLIALFCAVYAFDTTLVQEFILSALAEQAVRSRTLLERVKRLEPRNKSWLAKELAATRPIVITVGNVYVVDKALVLTVLQIIADNAISMLLL